MNENITQLSNNEDMAKFILRFAVGFLMIFHGVAKISAGVGFIENVFSSIGIPSFLAYAVYIGEFLAPLMLIVGFKVRIASVLIAGTMVVVILTTQMDNIFALNKYGAWAIELQMFYLLTSAAIFFQGAGKYSIYEKLKVKK